MERRCAHLQQRARSSFEKVLHAGEAPPHLQVIGFNVCSPPKSAETEARRLELARGDSRPGAARSPPPAPPKPASSSPRSALQQLLLTQPLHSSSAPLSIPPTQMVPRAASPFLLPPCPPATPSLSINQNVITSEKPPVNSPPSTPCCGILKSVVRSGKANADDPANQSFISIDHCEFLGQSQAFHTPSPRNRSAGGVRLNVHVTSEYSTPKSSRASMKENYGASNDETGYTDKKICVERPAKANISSGWLPDDDEEPSSAESFTDGGWKGGTQVQISQSSLRNEKGKKSCNSWIEESTSKKSSLFMFAVSSPVPEVGRHLHHEEYDAREDTDFLSSCHLCRRHLAHGKDVFMYRGDKAFCSTECRYQQIVVDERKERCPPPIIRSGASQVYGQHAYISTASPTVAAHHAVVIDQPHFINAAMAA